MANQAAPTTEQGEVIQSYRAPGVGPNPMGGWSSFIEDAEYVPELLFPISVQTYHKMRSDSQCSALMRGTTWPIRQYKWHIDPNGAKDVIVEKLARDYNLPIKGEDRKPSGRARDRFSWDNHIFHALLALTYGFYYFEQTGTIESDGFWHLRKLSPRPPRTIQDISVAPTGSLEWIKQNTDPTGQPIPINRLVAYVWEQEGGNWYGRSMFRACFGNWLIKQRLMRIDAINHERAGAGFPTIEAPPGASEEVIAALDQMAQSYKAGEKSGGALPNGAKLRLVGIEGNQPKTWDSIKGHNEEMARDFLMMFMGLAQGAGKQTGSYALGKSFIDWFSIAQQVVANWIADVFTAHMIEDDVDWNWGEEEEIVPKIGYERDPNPHLAVDELVSLITSGVLQVDEELESEIRDKYNLPEKSDTIIKPVAVKPDGSPLLPPAPSPSVPDEQPEPEDAAKGQPPAEEKAKASERRKRSVLAANSSLPLPDRPLRRQPHDYEVQASVNFAEIESQHQNILAGLLSQYQRIVDTQAQEIHDQIVSADGSIKKILKIEAESGAAEDLITSAMFDAAKYGVTTALVEAAQQSVSIDTPDLDKLESIFKQKSLAVDKNLTDGFNVVARQQAVMRTGFGNTTVEAAKKKKAGEPPPIVADDVETYLKTTSDRYRADRMTGAVVMGFNAGRKEVFRLGPIATYYASELLDVNTCETCAALDGTEYFSLADAEVDYPNAGFVDCLGGDRCRGTLVAIYNEAG